MVLYGDMLLLLFRMISVLLSFSLNFKHPGTFLGPSSLRKWLGANQIRGPFVFRQRSNEGSDSFNLEYLLSASCVPCMALDLGYRRNRTDVGLPSRSCLPVRSAQSGGSELLN